MERMIIVRVKCIHNDFNSSLIGIVGYAETAKVEENVMFYPDDEFPVYRVCLRRANVEEMED